MAQARDFYAEAQFRAAAHRLPPSQLARLAAVEIALRERGVPDDDPQVALLLAPIFGMAPGDEPVGRPLARPVDEKRDDTQGRSQGGGGQTANYLLPAARIDWPSLKARIRRAAASPAMRAYGLAALLLVLLVVLALYLPHRTDPTPPILTSDQPPPIESAATGATRTQRVSEPLYLIDNMVLLWGGAMIALAIAWRYLAPHLKDRRQVLRRQRIAEAAEGLADTSWLIAQAQFFNDPAFLESLRKLRRYFSMPSNRIDVRKSIRATIANRIEPVLCFADRRCSPEYLLLSEREQPGDHLAVLAAAWRSRLLDARIACAHYEFFGDPGTLRAVAESGGRIPAPPDQHEPLDAVLQSHAGAHVVVMLESFDALPHPRAYPRWLASDRHETTFHLMNPRAARHWATAEVALATMGVYAFDATQQGSALFGDQVSQAIDDAAADRPLPIPDAPAEADLGAWLAGHRTMLLSQEPPTERQVDIVIDTLQRWLDLDAFDWLRALAVMPIISPGYTLFCGTVLKDASIVTHDRFLALARLPWLRAAQMPDWVRLALTKTLSPPALERAAAVAAAFLDKPATPVDSAEQLLALRKAAESPERRAALAKRLQRSAHPVLNDQMLVGALQGAAPEQGALDLAVRSLYVQQTRWFRQPGWQSMLVAIPLAALILLQPENWRTQGWLPTGSHMVDGPPVPVPPQEAPPTPTPSATPAAQDTGTQPPPSQPPSTDGSTALNAASAKADAIAANVRAIGKTLDAASALAAGVTTGVLPGKALTGTTGSLYIQIASDAQRGQAEDLRAMLDGTTVQGIKLSAPIVQMRGSRSPNASQLRCFDVSGCAFAQYLQPQLTKAGVTASIVKFGPADFVHKGALPNNQLELWFGLGKGSKAGPATQLTGPTADAKNPRLDAATKEMLSNPRTSGLFPPRADQAPSQDSSAALAQSYPTKPGTRTINLFASYAEKGLNSEETATLDYIVEEYRQLGPWDVVAAVPAEATTGGPIAAKAEAAIAYLVAHGIPAGVISTRTVSPPQPLAPSAKGMADPPRPIAISIIPPSTPAKN